MFLSVRLSSAYLHIMKMLHFSTELPEVMSSQYKEQTFTSANCQALDTSDPNLLLEMQDLELHNIDLQVHVQMKLLGMVTCVFQATLFNFFSPFQGNLNSFSPSRFHITCPRGSVTTKKKHKFITVVNITYN